MRGHATSCIFFFFLLFLPSTTGFNGTVGASAWPNVLDLATAGSGVLNVVLNVTVPGVQLAQNGSLAFSPTDRLQSPFYLNLTRCSVAAAARAGELQSWTCQTVFDRPLTLNGTVFYLSWLDLYSVDQQHVLIPTASIPNVTFVVFSLATELPTEIPNATSALSAVSAAYWAFMVGGQGDEFYVYDSSNATTPWQPHELQLPANASTTGVTDLCFTSKNVTLIAGGKDYLSGKHSSGFLLLRYGNQTVAQYQYPTALTSVFCKSPIEDPVIYYLAAGLNNTLFVSTNGTDWSQPSYPQFSKPPLDFLSVTCVTASTCLAMGLREVGLVWQTVVLVSTDGGSTWALRTQIPAVFGGPDQSERGASLSCPAGTTTCYLATETYTGSRIRRTDDLGLTWTYPGQWDVLSDVKLDCVWVDECIAGAGTWLGPWQFPAQIRYTNDSGATWRTIYTGEIGEFIGACKCGGGSTPLCVCTSNRRMLIYETGTQQWSNVSFPTLLGPVAEYQSFVAADLLYELYRYLDGPNWLHTHNWLRGNPCVNGWYGVTCRGTNGAASNVIALRLPANGLKGQLPTTLGYLTGLQSLELEVNQLSGSIPSTVGRLTSLQRLSLYNNQLSGTLPSRLMYCEALETLALFNNQLTGALPDAWGSLPSLGWLYLYNNQLSGTIPATFGNLISLKWLDLRNNQLSGTLPDALGNLTTLQALDLSKNNLQGVVPSRWGALNQLAFFDVSSNSLSSYKFVPIYPDGQ
eukprot:EG_transcript_4001